MDLLDKYWVYILFDLKFKFNWKPNKIYLQFFTLAIILLIIV